MNEQLEHDSLVINIQMVHPVDENTIISILIT